MWEIGTAEYLFALVAGLAMVSAGGCSLVQMESAMHEAQAARENWVPVIGRITAQHAGGSRWRALRMVFYYEYEYDGRMYAGSRDSFFGSEPFEFPSSWDELRAMPAPGDAVQVYVNPKRPEQSVRSVRALEPEVYKRRKNRDVLVLGLGGIALVVGAVGLGLRKRFRLGHQT